MSLSLTMWKIWKIVIFVMFGDFAVTRDFIEEQANLCSYRSLCTRSNTSLHHGFGTPCCLECYCDKGCVDRGNCCPDYTYTQDGNRMSFNKTTTEGLLKGKENNEGCVRSYYGSLYNDTGYIMVDSCPPNFNDDSVKSACESGLGLSTTDIHPHIPVSNSITGRTFKNEYCRRCHENTTISDETVLFWEVWFVFVKHVEFNVMKLLYPFDLARHVLREERLIFSIVFKPSIEVNENEKCIKKVIIDTCSKEYLNTDIEAACNNYTWPIWSGNSVAHHKYKNYACVLCNGQKFDTFCHFHDYRELPHGWALLNVDTTEFHTGNNLYAGSHGNTSVNKIEKRFDGNKRLCPDGYVYDNRKAVCRQILCPYLFFVKKGKCEPVFAVMTNFVYIVAIEILLPFSLNNAPVHLIETAMASSFEALFIERIGVNNYEFQLFEVENATRTVTENTTYYLGLLVSANNFNGSYIAFLGMIHRFLNVDRQIKINISTEKIKASVNIGIKFDTASTSYSFRNKHIDLIVHWNPSNPNKVVSFDGGLSSYSSLPKEMKENSSTLLVTKLSFCYTLALQEKEITYLKRGFLSYGISILKHNMLERNYLEMETDSGDKEFYVCINDAIEDVGEVSSYIFNASESIESLFEWPSWKGNVRNRNPDETLSGTTFYQPENTINVKSLTALTGSAGFVTFIILIRLCVKRRHENHHGTSELITATARENIEMGNIDTRNKNGGLPHRDS